MNKSQIMEALLLNVFKGRNIKTFMEKNNRIEFFIVEGDSEDKKSYIIHFDENNDAYYIDKSGFKKILENSFEEISFKVVNHHQETIFFIAVDSGLIATGGKRCDFIVFNETDFCFVELKLNAYSSDPKTIEANIGKAIKQLEGTIDFFDNHLDKNYSGLNTEAYIVTPPHYPEMDALSGNYRNSFLEKNGILLFEQNYKEFS